MAMANIVANFSPFPSHPSPLSSIYLNPSLSLSLSSPSPPSLSVIHARARNNIDDSNAIRNASSPRMVLQRCLPGVHRLCSALTGSLAIFEPARSVLSPSPPPNPLSPHLPSASSAGLKDSRAESICLLNTGTVHTFLIGSTIMP